LVKFLLGGFLLTIPFSLRKIIFNFTRGFHEYETIFIYLSDLFLIGFVLIAIVYFLKNKEKFRVEKKIKIWGGLFLIFLGVSILKSSIPLFSLYFVFRIFLYFLTAIFISNFIKIKIIKKEFLFFIFSAGAIFQSIIAFLQFKIQGSLGLFFLGEPNLFWKAKGISVIPIGKIYILRAYGTFLHPNILGAFLILGFLSLVYFLIKEKDFFKKLITIISLFIVLIGIITTFSRTAWAVLVISLVLIFCFLIRKKRKELGLIFIFLIIAGVFPFYNFLNERVVVLKEESAVTVRISHIEIGKEIIKNNLIGVGAGSQIYYAEKEGVFEKFGMTNPLLWQPIHNMYLLIASEMGILGLLVFLIFIFKLFISNKLKDSEILITEIIFVSFLILGMFDHYFWTIANGQAIWWAVVGLLI